MLENREIMMRMFPAPFRENRIEPVDQYPALLRRTLASVAPQKCDRDPVVVILTPGHFNAAYYEHSFLADLMGIELVESQDLFVQGEYVYMRTTEGPKRVDVIQSGLRSIAFRLQAIQDKQAIGNIACCV